MELSSQIFWVLLICAATTIGFLFLEVHRLNLLQKEYHWRHQDKLVNVARLCTWSKSSNDFQISHEHIVRAHDQLEQIIQYYGNIHQVETVLRLPVGHVKQLQDFVNQQLEFIQSKLRGFLAETEALIKLEPELAQLAKLQDAKKPEQNKKSEPEPSQVHEVHQDDRSHRDLDQDQNNNNRDDGQNDRQIQPTDQFSFEWPHHRHGDDETDESDGSASDSEESIFSDRTR